MHRELLARRIAELKAEMSAGGLREALVRGLLYVGMERGQADERGFEAIRRLRATQTTLPPLSLQRFKTVVREQYFMLLLDQEAALSAIPTLLGGENIDKVEAWTVLRTVAIARGELTAGEMQRLERIAELFAPGEASTGKLSLMVSETSADTAIAS